MMSNPHVRRAWRRKPVLSLAGLTVLVLLAVATLRPSAAPAVAAKAPNFTLSRLNGAGRLSLRALRGHPVLVNFWSSTCDACKAEMPALEAAYRRFRSRGLVILGVDTDGDRPADARAMARRFGLTYPLVADTWETVTDLYGVAGFPTSAFVDTAGRLLGTLPGAVDATAIRCGFRLPGAGPCPAGVLPTPPPSSAGGAPSLSVADDVFSATQWRAHPFTLIDQYGARVSLASLRGKVVALTFLSAACRGQCPIMGRALARVQRLLGRDSRKVALVTISVEPEVDFPATAITFALESGLGHDWLYLTASRQTLTPIWRGYGAAAAPPPMPGHPSTDPIHSLFLYLIDRHGYIRALFDAPFQSSRVATAMRALLH